MGKRCDIVYRSNKKESNIPQLIRYSLLKSILLEKMSVKDASQKWRVHYSSAKQIARHAPRSHLQTIFKDYQGTKPTKYAQWQPIEPIHCSPSSSSDQDSMTSSFKTSTDKIGVVSTVGWDYLKWGQPK